MDKELQPTPTQRRRARTHAILVLVAFALFWVPVIVFAKLADDVHERQPLGADAPLLAYAYSIHSPLLDNVFLFFTAIGEPLVVAGAGLALAGATLYRHRYRMTALLVAGIGGAGAANLILKAVFARSRPSAFTPLVHESSYSFPSGHAMVSSAFVAVVILLAWHTKWRIPVIVVGALTTLAIGASRVYLGVHYPSDVLAGWSVGLVWVAITGSLVLNRPFALGRRLGRVFHHEA